jgi:amino acid transporter
MQQNVSFKKNISTFSLTMTGVTTIIGSGWLLGTQKIAMIAGPASLVSWLLGALVALLVGLFYIEIGSANPSAGGIGFYSHITHGRFCGFLTSWINWLSIVAVPPIEAQGIVQYLSQLDAKFEALYNVTTHALTAPGIAFAIVLMFVFMFINYWSVQFFIRFNNFFTLIKVVVPLLTIGCLTYNGLHAANFGTNLHEFMPFGAKAILTSIVTSGVVMSFNGFQSPLTFSEEITSPKTMLPIAVISSILLALVVYFLLQVVFIGSINPSMLAQGWEHINYRSPYVDLLLLANMQLMVTTVYAGSVISPGACGAAFMASSSRVLYSLSQQKHLPAFLSRLNPVYQNPRTSIITCTLVGLLFLFIFKGWYQLVAVISVIHVFSYLPAPVITIANRIKNPRILNSKDQFVLPGGKVFAPILLFILSLLLFYAEWPLTGEMLVLLLPGFVFYFYYEYKIYHFDGFKKALKGASWLLLYILGISLIAFMGDNPSIGQEMISTPVSIGLLAVLSVFTYIYGAFFALV